MNPDSTDKRHRQLFALALRVLGAYLLTQALYQVGTCINILTDLYKLGYASSGAFALHAVIDVVAGLYLIQGAPGLVNFAYRQQRPKLSQVMRESASDVENRVR